MRLLSAAGPRGNCRKLSIVMTEPTREQDRWRQIEEIFLVALDLSPTELPAYLEGACAGDEDLRREVERMIAADQRTEGLLESPVAGLPSWDALQEAAEKDEKTASAPTQVWVGHTSMVQGELLAERFRVVRFIAAGGMGEVYEAEDLELGEQVAIKTVRPELTRDEATMERFRREVQLARRVSHPAVCRCYDIFHHNFPPVEKQPERPSLTFLSMEFLDGETLAERLDRTGPMTTDEALPLVRQIAEGLAAAHDEGIVHRDLKSANVLLVATPRGLRAVVTDFGLARLGSGGGTITKSGLTLGTPAYMAPEQVKGEEITPAADVYALGILMYEMVTGHFPFEADDSLVMALRRLHEDPTSPRHYVQDLDPRWERTILRCLKRTSAERFATAREVIRFLESPAAADPETPGRRWLSVALLAFTLAVLGLMAGWYAGRHPAESPAAVPTMGEEAVVPRRSVAVLGFKNLSNQEEMRWLSMALAEMLTMELAVGERLRTIPGANIARMKVELDLENESSFATDTLKAIQRHLGCDLVVGGAYIVTGEALRLDVRIEDVVEGTAEVLLTESGSQAELLALVARTGRRLRAELGFEEPAASAGVDRALPQAPEAARLYAEGVARLRLFDALGARYKLEAAADIDPGAPLVHAALAESWKSLGYDSEARAAARRAYELREALPPTERTLVEARFHEAMGEREKAVAIYQAWNDLFPDDVDQGLRLAAVQTASGRGEDALATLDELRRLPSPAGDDPRLDLAEAVAAESLSDYRRTLRAAVRGAERSRTLGARWLLANALFHQGRALWRLGKMDEAEEVAIRSEAMLEGLKDRSGFADALNLRANIAENQGRLEEAVKLYEWALAAHREIGYQAGVTQVLNNLAVALRRTDEKRAEALYVEALAIARQLERKRDIAQGLHNLALLRRNQEDLSAAKELFEQSLALAEEIGDRGIESTCLNNLASLLREQGDLDAASETFERALALAREIGDKRGVASRLNNLGILRRQRGELEGAFEAFKESGAIYRELGDERRLRLRLINLASLERKRGYLAASRALYEEVEELQAQVDDTGVRANWLNGFGLVHAAEGDLVTAQRMVEEGIALRRSLGAEARVLVGQTDLAMIHLYAGHPKEAEILARDAARGLVKMEQADDAVIAETLWSRALLAQGRLGEAREVLEKAKPSAVSHDLESRLRFELIQAALDARGPRPEAGFAWIEDLLRQAREMGFGELVLEIRLVQGFAALDGGRIEEGRSQLHELVAEASAQGFLSLAHQAERSLKS